MRAPKAKEWNGLTLMADGMEHYMKGPQWAQLPTIVQSEIRAAVTWIRNMARIRGRREIARAMMEEQPGLYVKPPAYNPDWFNKPGYHIKPKESK